MNMERRTKTLILTVVFLVFAVAFLWYREQQPVQASYTTPSPEEVVRLYFTSWDEKRYADMYSTISDGFKRIEPSAKDLSTFRTYVEKQQIAGVKILSLRETSHDDTAATVAYTATFQMADGKTVPFEGTTTLKYRTGDIIQGWKLIHPYGEQVDST